MSDTEPHEVVVSTPIMIPQSTSVTKTIIAQSASPVTATASIQQGGDAGPFYVMVTPAQEIIAHTTPARRKSGPQVQAALVRAFEPNKSGVQALVRAYDGPNKSGVQTALVRAFEPNKSDVQATLVRAYESNNRGARDEKRRATHNEVERRRRDKINNWISKLARMVPGCNQDHTKQGQSKGGILAKTADYIQDLLEENQRLKSNQKQYDRMLADMESLRAQLAQEKKDNARLRQTLERHDIPMEEDSSNTN